MWDTSAVCGTHRVLCVVAYTSACVWYTSAVCGTQVPGRLVRARNYVRSRLARQLQTLQHKWEVRISEVHREETGMKMGRGHALSARTASPGSDGFIHMGHRQTLMGRYDCPVNAPFTPVPVRARTHSPGARARPCAFSAAKLPAPKRGWRSGKLPEAKRMRLRLRSCGCGYAVAIAGSQKHTFTPRNRNRL